MSTGVSPCPPSRFYPSHLCLLRPVPSFDWIWEERGPLASRAAPSLQHPDSSHGQGFVPGDSLS